MISTNEKDYLEQDPEIRNQNFVCLSFVSPEDILKSKETFLLEKFVQHISTKLNECVDNLEKTNPDISNDLRSFKELYEPIFNTNKIHENFRNFITQNNTPLEDEFHKQNDFQTSIRGIKVRGVYNTIDEAQHRSKQLQSIEQNKFSIYIAQVGCWCPWSPHPDNIENQEFAESSLNTLMHKYDENVEKSQHFYNERKNDLTKRLQEEENKKKSNIASSSIIEDTDIKGKGKMYESDDPWIQSKQ